MPTKTIDVSKSNTKLNELVSEALEGTEIILTRGNTPLVRLVPISSPTLQARTPGLHPGALKMQPDFDEPLSDEYWLGAV